MIKPRAAALAARRIPEHLSDEAAMFLEPAACVLRGINRSSVREYTSHFPVVALILGAGSMGLLHLLVLKALNPAFRVIVSDPIEERRKLARTLGADVVAEPGAATKDAARQLSSGYGADVAFDTVGGAALLSAALESTREGGTAVLFAHAAAGHRAAFEINSFFKHERKLLGTYSGSMKEQDETFTLLESGLLDPRRLISHRLRLEDFTRGVELVRMQKALKVVFTMEGSFGE
ncbi:MAG TPA: zinc-binding dehydrogenase [Thermoanaerobaculia bacterium]|nr:zinc-binding dehydrogenase [Thermoanaerobaculia bacterium]